MPQPVDEDSIPCQTCLGRMGRNPDMYEQCLKPLPTASQGAGRRRVRCDHCASSNHTCREIPAAAHTAVRYMLALRKLYWEDEVTKNEFTKAYKTARRSIRNARAALDAEAGGGAGDSDDSSNATPARITPAQRPLPQFAPAQFVPHRSNAPALNAPAHGPRFAPPQGNVQNPVVVKSEDPQQGEGSDGNIESMGVAETLHQILRTLIRIDQRMERLEARV